MNAPTMQVQETAKTSPDKTAGISLEGQQAKGFLSLVHYLGIEKKVFKKRWKGLYNAAIFIPCII